MTDDKMETGRKNLRGKQIGDYEQCNHLQSMILRMSKKFDGSSASDKEFGHIYLELIVKCT